MRHRYSSRCLEKNAPSKTCMHMQRGTHGSVRTALHIVCEMYRARQGLTHLMERPARHKRERIFDDLPGHHSVQDTQGVVGSENR